MTHDDSSERNRRAHLRPTTKLLLERSFEDKWISPFRYQQPVVVIPYSNVNFPTVVDINIYTSITFRRSMRCDFCGCLAFVFVGFKRGFPIYGVKTDERSSIDI